MNSLRISFWMVPSRSARGESEGDRQALLPGGEVAAVKGVRVLGGRETGILPDRPRPPGIHRRAHAAGERREARQAGIGGHVLGGVEGLDVDPLRRVPGQVGALHFLGGGSGPGVEGGFVGHFKYPFGLRLSKPRPFSWYARKKNGPSPRSGRTEGGGPSNALERRRALLEERHAALHRICRTARGALVLGLAQQGRLVAVLE